MQHGFRMYRLGGASHRDSFFSGEIKFLGRRRVSARMTSVEKPAAAAGFAPPAAPDRGCAQGAPQCRVACRLPRGDAGIRRHGVAHPIACAVLSSGIALLATYDIFWFHRHRKYLLFGDETDQSRQRSRFAEIKLCLAAVMTAVCLALTISFLAVGYSLPSPKALQDGCGYGNFRPGGPAGWEKNPCAHCADRGSCLEEQTYNQDLGFSCNSTCVEMRDAWAASVVKTNPAANNLCPPPPRDINTVVSFSCKADGFWMMVTTVVSMIWMASLWELRKRSAAAGDMISIMTPFWNERDC